jgi:hypothetical protein
MATALCPAAAEEKPNAIGPKLPTAWAPTPMAKPPVPAAVAPKPTATPLAAFAVEP